MRGRCQTLSTFRGGALLRDRKNRGLHPHSIPKPSARGTFSSAACKRGEDEEADGDEPQRASFAILVVAAAQLGSAQPHDHERGPDLNRRVDANPTRAIEPAAMPAEIATTASTTF